MHTEENTPKAFKVGAEFGIHRMEDGDRLTLSFNTVAPNVFIKVEMICVNQIVESFEIKLEDQLNIITMEKIISNLACSAITRQAQLEVEEEFGFDHEPLAEKKIIIIPRKGPAKGLKYVWDDGDTDYQLVETGPFNDSTSTLNPLTYQKLIPYIQELVA